MIWTFLTIKWNIGATAKKEKYKSYKKTKLTCLRRWRRGCMKDKRCFSYNKMKCYQSSIIKQVTYKEMTQIKYYNELIILWSKKAN